MMLTKEEFLRNIDELFERRGWRVYYYHYGNNRAATLASNFGVAVKDNFQFRNFPFVKCKVLPDNRRIYYTPNNGDYTETQIIPGNGDIFCRTADEAAAKGFSPS